MSLAYFLHLRYRTVDFMGKRTAPTRKHCFYDFDTSNFNAFRIFVQTFFALDFYMDFDRHLGCILAQDAILSRLCVGANRAYGVLIRSLEKGIKGSGETSFTESTGRGFVQQDCFGPGNSLEALFGF